MSAARWLRSALLTGIGSVCLVSGVTARDAVTLYVPALSSPTGGLGFGVSAIVGLQVWQTLRRRAEGARTDFGDGLIVWSPRPLELRSHEAAEAAARKSNVLGQMVFWGAAYDYGDSVVAQFNLSLPAYNDFREARPELWTIATGSSERKRVLTADLPSRRYAFEPVVLDRDVVAAFSNPAGLPVFENPQGGTAIARLGGEFTALKSQNDAVLVRTGAATGWVRLQPISTRRSEAVDFVSGLMRVYRADWQGAREYLGRVVDAASTPTALRTDAYLLRAMAAARASSDAAADLSRAAELSPHARRVVIYQLMAQIEQAAHTDACNRDSNLKAIETVLREKSYVFLPDDPWMAQWRSMAKSWRDDCASR